MAGLQRVDITKPKWDQSTYLGRVKHFFILTNPLNLFATSKQLDNAKCIYDTYRAGKSLPPGVTMDHVWKAKYLYDSAFHPDTGEKLVVFGRMSSQMPMNIIITAGMMAYYNSRSATIFWQWFNQSFNAVINYSNRSGDEPISVKQMVVSYVLATGGALTTALTLNKQAKRAPPLIGRFVPFVAVAAANCINIPCMRAQELREGVPVFDSNNNRLGTSRIAAREGITAVVCSRILMAVPTMVLIPVIVDRLEKRGFFKKYPRGNIPLQAGLCALILTFAIPMGCAVFSQIVSVNISHLEKDIQENAKNISPPPITCYYNKGL